MALPPEPTASGPFGAPPAGGAGPVAPGSAATVKVPSAAGYWIAGVVILVGAVVAVIWFVAGVSNLFSAVDSYPRFVVPGQITTSLQAERYKVFAEYSGASTDVNGVFRVGDVSVTDSSGRTIPVSSAFSEETYSWDGHEGRSIAEFDAPVAGTYTVKATGPATPSATRVQVAIGRGLQPSAIVPLFAAAGLGGLAVLVGIVLIVVTAVRRGRAKRRAHPVPAFAGGPPGPYPGAYPGGPTPYGQWGPPPSPWGAPGPVAPPPAWGAPPGPPPGGQWPQPYPPAYPPSYPPPVDQPYPPPIEPGYPPGAPVSPPARAPETPPIVPPGWGGAPGGPGPEPTAQGVEPADEHPDPDPGPDQP